MQPTEQEQKFAMSAGSEVKQRLTDFKEKLFSIGTLSYNVNNEFLALEDNREHSGSAGMAGKDNKLGA